ncbi:chromosome segregation protein SMC [Aliidiomarina celeris]|uniref:chromosome segregation protein SMC n=1 Tax=Aliidiomarina celeris TaxID=2249428 RepID=UPI000DE91864|nr:chromosome segregation protein SMC [Aliidiomarina celeris]
MRLKYIRLAGFKSFVDATKVAFPEQMTCIVGPNGCGKSNVIDAVRWVLGESSAKNLRGDAMTDVIFNGSTARKPVSQASVELVFDNSDGRLQGEFANYNEVSVKRVVTRDAQSLYFLNGAKCRRRDITDLFLGTGLGPRSYAIIEQGMISRLIESRPQELRVFIEEAAGISKYKERRKETESRIGRTRENLERLTDVREELGQQLAKLQRQAAAAKRYQTLKAEERRYKSELQALRWLHYQQQCDRVEDELKAQETELEKWLAEQRGSERGQTELREREHEAQDRVDQAQEQFYQSSTQVTSVEQQIRHQRQLSIQREQQRQALAQQREQLQAEIQSDSELLNEVEQQRETLGELQEEVAERLLIAQQQQEEAEVAFENWQHEHSELRESRSLRVEKRSVVQAELRASEQFMQQIEQRLKQIDEALQKLQVQQLEDPAVYQETLAETQQALSAAQQQQQTDKQRLANSRSELEQFVAQRDKLHTELQQALGRKASLEQLLQAKTEPLLDNIQQWLDTQAQWGPLRSLLQVPEWLQSAVENVLEKWLQAPVLKAQAGAEQNIPSVLNSPLLWARSGATTQNEQRSLNDFFQPNETLALLDAIAWAETPDEAQLALKNPAVVAVCTANGQVYGKGWRDGAGQQEAGQLRWQEELNAVNDSLVNFEQALADTSERVANAQQQRQDLELQMENHASRVQLLQSELMQSEQKLQQLLREREQAQTRQQELAHEAATLRNDYQRLQAEQAERQQSLAQLSASESDLDAKFERSQQQGEQLRGQQRSFASQTQEAQQQVHRVQLEWQQSQSRSEHLQKQLERLNSQYSDICERLAEYQQEEQEGEEIALLEEQLAELLLLREQAEAELRETREQLSAVQQELSIINQGQSAVLAQIAKQREQVEASKLALAAARERGHALLEAFQDLQVSLKEVLANLPENANEKEWQQELEERTRKIAQLGAINLAAIDEVEAQAERKSYLDAQHEDLTASLSTLEDAMKKIDRETRARFKSTYDQVNSDLQQLFPKVFGGGSAYLELTGEDLLETGVTIMARPPGKKNSTIHLLSGGEKALTALALVFAIFRLNPAPFCLLDEVDAPLDDINVGRFCRLVQEMSESVQFIYISHNKIAMEMATHLAGVTMQEPGVSRLVAVDVDEALALAEAV